MAESSAISFDITLVHVLVFLNSKDPVTIGLISSCKAIKLILEVSTMGGGLPALLVGAVVRTGPRRWARLRSPYYQLGEGQRNSWLEPVPLYGTVLPPESRFSMPLLS
jgi:hypothetical protein